MPKTEKNRVGSLLTSLTRGRALIVRIVDRRPITSFLVVLGILILLIVTGSFLRKPQIKEQTVTAPAKQITVYNIGTAPKIAVSASVEKSGIVKITAQTPAIVANINVTVGQQVVKGSNLMSLASNYTGSNPAAVQAQIAQTQYKNVKDTFNDQKDLIQKQRELADKNRENADKIRDITNQSLGETRSLLSLNDSIIASLQLNLQSQTPGSAAYVATWQQISQFQTATNQIKQGLRTAEFQAGSDNTPSKIADLQTDIAKRQLDLQEKSLALTLETSRLQAALAAVTAESYHPTAPFAGTVERVHVVVGQTVTPGTVLVTITGNSQSATLTAFVPLTIAKSVSLLNPATIHVRDNNFELTPIYISQEATEGQLYSVVFAIPNEVELTLTDKSTIIIDLALDTAYPSGVNPYVPIDSVHQTQEEAFVFVEQNGEAVSKKVELGAVEGSYIQVVNGLETNDRVIINRNVIAGDRVEVKS